MSDIKVFKKSFTTPAVRAVFPQITKPHEKYGYSIDVDLFDNPELATAIEQQAKDVLAAAQASIGTDAVPTNALFRKGEFQKGDRKGEPFFRASFKMKAERMVKGATVAQRPRVVDSHRNPVTEHVFGGSKVKIAYNIQFTLMPTGTYLSLKLVAVQVLEHVGPGGEALIEDLFGEEDGFVSQGTSTDDAPSNTDNDDTSDGPVTGREF